VGYLECLTHQSRLLEELENGRRKFQLACEGCCKLLEATAEISRYEPPPKSGYLCESCANTWNGEWWIKLDNGTILERYHSYDLGIEAAKAIARDLGCRLQIEHQRGAFKHILPHQLRAQPPEAIASEVNHHYEGKIYS